MNTTPPHPIPPLRTTLRRLGQAWFGLNADEQRALTLVLGLFILGILARYWHAVLR